MKIIKIKMIFFIMTRCVIIYRMALKSQFGKTHYSERPDVKLQKYGLNMCMLSTQGEIVDWTQITFL